MLDKLRHKNTSKKILWVVTVIIILSFGVFGVAYQMDHVNSAGEIFGHKVSLRDFEKAYRDSRDQSILTYGDRFFQAGNNLDLESEAWNRLIMLKEVKKRRIQTTDQEVVSFIAELPFFQRDGKFDQNLYETMVRNSRIFGRRPKDFESGVRGSIAIRKLFDLAGGPVVITDDQLKAEYVRRHEKIKLTYALFSPSDFTEGLSATNEEAQKFYDQYKEKFREPPMVNVQYVHMLYPDKADDAKKEAVKKDAIALAHELTPEADFAAAAKKYNQELKESGFFTQEQPLLTFAWSPEFVDKIFAMKTGEISSPMEAPDGWQVIKLKEKKESTVPEFAAVEEKAKQAVIDEKAKEAARAKAAGVLKDIQTQIPAKDFKAVTEGLGLKTEETTEFSRGEYINAPGLIAELQEPSLKLNDSQKLSELVETSQGSAILYLSSVQPIEEKKFGEDKEDFRQMMTAQQRSQAIMTFINKLKLDANLKIDLKGKIRYQ